MNTLNVVQLELLAELKAYGNVVGKLLAKVELDGDVDKRWLAIARTRIQEGFMAARRSIEQPKDF